MAYKFIKTTYGDDWIGLKVVIEGKEVWATCSPQVKDFAKKNFKEGDDIDFQYEVTDGKYKITSKVTKAGGATSAPAEEGPSQEYSQPEATASYGPERSKNDSIVRQTAGKITGSCMIAMQGQVNPQNVKSLFDEIFEHVLQKIQ